MKMIHSYVLFVVSICSLVYASQPHNSNNNYGPNPSSYHASSSLSPSGGSGSSYPPPPQSQTEDERLYYEKQKQQQQQQQLYQQINKQGSSAPPPPLPPHMSSTYSYGTHPNQHPQHNMFSSTDPSRPVGYNSGYAAIVPRPPSYDRIQPQVQESSGTGLFAKLKSSIFAAGSAISESLTGPYYDEGRPLQQQQQQQLLPLPPPPPVYSRPPPPHDSPLGGGRGGPFPGYSQSPAGQRAISPSGLSHTGGAGQHQYGSSSQPISQEESSSSAGGGVGLIDKIKTLFNAEDSSSGGGLSYPNSRDFQGQYVPQQPSYPPRQQQPFNGPLGSPPHLHPYESHQPVTPKDSRGVPADLHPANIPGFPSPQQQQQQQYMAAGTASSTYRDDYRGEGYGGSNTAIPNDNVPNSPSYNYPPHMRGPAPPPPGRSSIPGQGYDQYDNRETQLHYSNNQPPPNYPGYGQPPQMPPNYPQMPLPEPVDPISLISPDPQVFNYDGSTTHTSEPSSSSSCIVMISKPREFFKKKQTFTQAGANNIQVFSDFEHVFTRFITAEGDRTLGSAELLETSGAVQRSAVDKLNKISEEFENSMDHDAYQELNARCQEVIAREGMLHIAAVAPVTKEFTKQLGLRDGWKEAMSSLASRGVPIYLFSSGYGDVVTQVLIQGLADSSSSSSSNGAGSSSSNSPMSSGASTLPQNIRIISNFFRTAPDGTVRAFSQPIIHERNKNASTAATQMGFSVLPRPYALVLGSHEDDVSMTEGVVGLKEQISIGFIELSEDITQRLPIFLNAFDVVIVGDGSFKYVRSTIDDVLQIISSSTTSTSGSSSSSSQRSSSSSIALGLKNRLGMFLNPTSSSSPGPGTNAAGVTADNISTGFYRPQQQPLNQQSSNNNYQQPPPTEVYRKSYLDYQDF